jgi:hypothetical protein
MANFRTALLIAATASLLACGPALAQAEKKTPPPNSGPTSATTVNPELQKQLAPNRRSAKKARRDTCEREATDKQLHFAKRYRFMRQCMKG